MMNFINAIWNWLFNSHASHSVILEDYIVNSGEFGARSNGAKPICNRRATSNDANFLSIDYNNYDNIAAHAETIPNDHFVMMHTLRHKQFLLSHESILLFKINDNSYSVHNSQMKGNHESIKNPLISISRDITLFLPPGSGVGFAKDGGIDYYFKNSTPEESIIKDIILFIDFIENHKTIAINPSTGRCLKVYQDGDIKFRLSPQQDYMSFNSKKVDSFIKDNFFALSGIGNTLTYLGKDSINLISLPNDILSKICSYLKLKDVLPDVKHNMQCADDQTIPLLGKEPTE